SVPIRFCTGAVIQLMTRPSRQSGRYGSTSALAATGRPLVDVLLQVGEERLYLVVGPAVRDRGHLVSPLPDQLLQTRSLREQGVVRDIRPEAALPLKPVAFRARALPLAASECAPCSAEPGCVVGLRLHVDDGLHRRVEDAAEPPPSPAIGSDLVGFEPRLGHVTRDRLELVAELRHPPAL